MAAVKKRKGMSLEEKRATMLAIFHDTVRSLQCEDEQGSRRGWLGFGEMHLAVRFKFEWRCSRAANLTWMILRKRCTP